MCHLAKAVAERHAPKLHQLELENFTSPNYLALFVPPDADNLLRSMTSEFAEQVKQFGVQVEAYKKQHHLSLAYKYHSQYAEQLQKLAFSKNKTKSIM